MIQTRHPGRKWKLMRARAMNVATLAELFRETAEHYGHYEKTHAEHHWCDWYAPYLSARQNGISPAEAAAFPLLAAFNNGGVYAGRFAGLSPWE